MKKSGKGHWAGDRKRTTIGWAAVHLLPPKAASRPVRLAALGFTGFVLLAFALALAGLPLVPTL